MVILLLTAGAVYEFRKNRKTKHIIAYICFSAVVVALKFLPEMSIVKYIINVMGGI